VKIPDYISPVVGYRVWQWNAAGLKSLNGELAAWQSSCGSMPGCCLRNNRRPCERSA
jgi:hypothetical protein